MEKYKKAFFDEKKKNHPDFNSLKKILLEIYEKENETKLELNKLTIEEQSEIVKWLNLNLIKKIGITYNREVPVSIPFVSNCLSQKVSMISQFHCPLCNNKEFSPAQIISIRISAISKQSMSRKPLLRKAFEKAIKSRFVTKEKMFDKNDKLCVYTTFILGKNNRDKDLDNMSKALMDALQGSLFDSDANIDHLNLVKIKHDGNEDFVKISIRKSDINNHSDVLFPIMVHNWAGAEFLSLNDFIE